MKEKNLQKRLTAFLTVAFGCKSTFGGILRAKLKFR